MRTSKTYRPIDLPPLTESQIKEIEALKNISDADIDLSDAPEMTEEQLVRLSPHYAMSLHATNRKINN